ncbi:MAG TPA: SDR family oxidoreductase [Candidatus Limnocylindrales bacterium]|nr:SDR family oxidoreductase [Candidatus Limnocylindrales bacterium]
MRVLVTGHKGYIGMVMVPMLLKAGHRVVGLDTNFYETCTFGSDVDLVPEIRKDLRDVEASDLKGFDAVIHLAALSNDPLGDLNPDLTYDINHKATVRLAEIAKQVGISRFLFSSSCSNYGAAGDALLNEEAPFHPVTAYGISKVRAEQDLVKLADDNFSPILLRSATAYGVSPRLRLDVVLNNLTASAFITGKIFLKSDGTPWRPIVHIEDISRAFLAVLQAPRELVHNQAFNVGRPEENYRIREIAEIVKQTIPHCYIEFAKDAGPDKRCYRVDSGKLIRTLPEYKPQWNARQGAEQLYKAYQQVGLTITDFEGPKYKRIDQIKKLIHEGRLDENLRWRDK